MHREKWKDRETAHEWTGHLQGVPLLIPPTREITRVLVELIEETIRPGIDLSFAIQHRTHDLRLVLRPRLKKMNGYSISFKALRLHSTSNAIEDMIAVRFKNNLYAGLRNISQELSHHGLARRMQMDFRIFNQQQIVGISRQGSHDNRKNLGQPKTGMNRSMKIHAFRCSQSQPHRIGVGNSLDIQLAAWKKLAHAQLDLTQTGRRSAFNSQSRQNRFVAARIQDTDRIFSARPNNGRKMSIL